MSHKKWPYWPSSHPCHNRRRETRSFSFFSPPSDEGRDEDGRRRREEDFAAVVFAVVDVDDVAAVVEGDLVENRGKATKLRNESWHLEFRRWKGRGEVREGPPSSTRISRWVAETKLVSNYRVKVSKTTRMMASQTP